ncbi:MAG: MBL fold metallo-hydrolase [Desulfobulbaceae bacterium]|nr:MBL fold metallo-hydrolase [Desulfobulbaceae bacterium]
MRVEQLVVGMMGVCCYIVFCDKTKEAAVIDPGGDEERILKYLRDQSLSTKYIINTHGHLDHVCGNAAVQQGTGAQIIMHEADVAYFSDPAIRRYFSGLGLTESPPVDVAVRDGEMIAIGQEQLQVLHTPGHTPGGLCLYNAPHCFTGDTLFVGAVGRTDFPKGSMQQLIDSIRSKLLVLPADTLVWPGHGYGGLQSTIGQEARSNPYL